MGLKKRAEERTKEVLQVYLNEISRIPLLTVEDERALGYSARSGDEEAIKKLVESNLRFVVKVAKKYRNCGVAFLDLINQGNLGLMEAARRFDPDRNVRFISYAIWWIRQSILTILSDMSHPIRLPLKINSLVYKARNHHRRMEQNDVQEYEQFEGLTREAFTELLKIGVEPLSLDQPVGDGNSVLEDLMVQKMAGAENGLIQDDLKQNLRAAINQLRPNEREVLYLRFGIDQERCLTLKQIGEKIGISRERVRQIQEKALAKLRHSPEARSFYATTLEGAA